MQNSSFFMTYYSVWFTRFIFRCGHIQEISSTYKSKLPHLSASLTVFFLFLASTTASVAVTTNETRCGIAPQQLEHLKTIGTQIVERGFAPGIVTSIYCEGHALLTDVHGSADVEHDKKLKEDDLFRVYSMTKPVTSLAIMMLAEDGRLGLDDPIARFIPEFGAAKVYLSGDKPETIETTMPVRAPTIRDLLRHSAGLTYRSTAGVIQKMYVLRGIDNGAGSVVVPEDNSQPVGSLEELARRIANIPLLNQPGERFSYGNATDVLGLIVEVAAGLPLREFMARRIFMPLQMNDTSFEVSPKNVKRLTAAYWAKSSVPPDGRILRETNTDKLGRGNFSLAEDPTKSVFSKKRLIDFGGAGLVSSAADYQHFLQMLLAGGIYDGKRIVSAESVAEMTRNQLQASALSAPELAAQGLGFGLGFARFVDVAKAPAAVSPNIYFWGGAASTYFWVDPDRKITGVIMTQVFGGDITPFYVDMLNGIYPLKNATKTQNVEKLVSKLNVEKVN